MLAFVIIRDRVTYARQCVQALGVAGLDVVAVDHASAWPPARRWLPGLRFKHGIEVWYESDNRHPRDLWREGGPVQHYVKPDERFVVTDCDVVPDNDCPADWLDLLGVLLDLNPRAIKAGLGLRTDDLPEHYAHRDDVQAWEEKHQRPAAPWVVGTAAIPQPPAVWASVDTTLAMYRGPEPFQLGPAIRTVGPYWARHLPWYEDTANPSEEIAFYNARAEHGHWRAPDGYIDEYGLGPS